MRLRRNGNRFAFKIPQEFQQLRYSQSLFMIFYSRNLFRWTTNITRYFTEVYDKEKNCLNGEKKVLPTRIKKKNSFSWKFTTESSKEVLRTHETISSSHYQPFEKKANHSSFSPARLKVNGALAIIHFRFFSSFKINENDNYRIRL